MRNFVIFFEEKEGTSPLVRLLDNFATVSVVHQVDNSGWEPFDRHNAGPMSISDLERCLDLVYGGGTVDMASLNRIYTRTAVRPLESLPPGKSIGFKMRFRSPRGTPRLVRSIVRRLGLSRRVVDRVFQRPFRDRMIDVLRKHDVFVFLAVRQDVLRWALSKYHGDGSGKRGHLQFKIASGQISADKLDKILVDCDRLERIIAQCEAEHERKHALMREFKAAGLHVQPLCYEDFVDDKVRYFEHLLNCIDVEVTRQDIDAALQSGTDFKKVHSDRIADFVDNHAEVLEKFGDRFASWQSHASQN